MEAAGSSEALVTIYHTTRRYIRVIVTVVRTSQRKKLLRFSYKLHVSPCCIQASSISSDMRARVIDRHSQNCKVFLFWEAARGDEHSLGMPFTRRARPICICVHSSNKCVSVCLSVCPDKNMSVLGEATFINPTFLIIFNNDKMGWYILLQND
jgi:hypothetical protein